MSEVFEGYERQYCEISAALSRKCTSAALLDGEQKKQKVSEIKSGVDDAESLIRKMDLEARSLQPSVKAGLLAKLREYKSDLNNLKSELKKITTVNPNQAAREDLLESGMADTLMVSADQRGRLMMSTERLNQSTERVKESRRTILETEELGVSILQDLHQQRQSLLHAHNTMVVLRSKICAWESLTQVTRYLAPVGTCSAILLFEEQVLVGIIQWPSFSHTL
ncbi:vesicle transport v-SNARE 11-like isoform X1 [Musa acuminata AAA Group]|uniref:vesicle transport v-SNARE 11-like isoform X1 n=2 Tax=Musa acuminata AAA Group TaxID=214697 RepID=UPI0031E30AAF